MNEIESIKKSEFQRVNRPLSEKIIMEGFPPCIENLMIQALDIKDINNLSKERISSLDKIISKIKILSKEGSKDVREKRTIVRELLELQRVQGNSLGGNIPSEDSLFKEELLRISKENLKTLLATTRQLSDPVPSEKDVKTISMSRTTAFKTQDTSMNSQDPKFDMTTAQLQENMSKLKNSEHKYEMLEKSSKQKIERLQSHIDAMTNMYNQVIKSKELRQSNQ